MRNYILILFPILLITGCRQVSKEELTTRDIELFKNTIAWDLAQAVDDNNGEEIEDILKHNPKIVNFQDPIFGTTVLMWAVGSRKYESAKALLDNGANPNIISKTGTTALFSAISFAWNDVEANEDPKFVKLLLDYKANPNINYCEPRTIGETSVTECGTSPLMFSINSGFEKVKLLVNAGSIIDYATESGRTAASEALLSIDVNSAYFLIVEKKAKISAPFYFRSLNEADTIVFSKPHYPVDLLLNWTFDLKSSDYQKKKEIIAEFKRQGVDYESRRKYVSNTMLSRMQKLYPNNWQQYLKKY